MVPWIKWSLPFLIVSTQKLLKQLLSFLNLHLQEKNEFITSIHSWDTVNFRFPWLDWPYLFWTIPTKIFFDQFLIYVNWYQHAKIRLHYIDLFWSYGLWKNPAIWLVEIILAPISGKKISQMWDLCSNTVNDVKFHYETNSVKINNQVFPKIHKTMFLSHFWSIFPILGAKKIFPENPVLSRTTSYGFLAPKNNDTIPRKHPEREKDG